MHSTKLGALCAHLLLLATTLLALAAPSAAAPVSAMQGSSRADRKDAEVLPDFVASERIGELPTSIDLRQWLPPVGEQTMNDCAAWAFGYAGRSYLEAVDQGWKPNSVERVFSPTFIYNQVNGGVDEGSQVTKVLELLRTSGAATLATCPYRPRDFTSKPPEKALEEAGIFPIQGYYALTDGPAVRAALADRNIVLCCVRTNPIFSSGRYEVYDAAKHAEGSSMRKPGQPHSFHAMAIVGYSDAKHAFLFMNSWGREWGQYGYVWVDYDVLARFNSTETTEELMDFGVVMVDVPQSVVRSEGKYKAVDLSAASIDVRYDGAYWYSKEKRHEYGFSMRVVSEPELLNALESVTWIVSSGDQSVIGESKLASNGFSLFTVMREPEARVFAQLMFKDKRPTLNLRSQLEVEPIAPRDVGLTRVDTYLGASNGKPWWSYTLVPQLSDADWRDLDRVFFSYEDQGSWYAKAYVHPGGGRPDWARSAPWAPDFSSSEPRRTRAEFRFHDGGAGVAELDATPFEDPPDDGVRVESKWRPEGNDEDESWWFYEVRVHYPPRVADEVRGVVLDLDGTQVAAELWEEPGRIYHVYSGFTRAPFLVTATVFFRGDVPGFGTFAMVDAKVELGPEMAPGNGLGAVISSSDSYAGEIDGAPTFDVALRLGGLCAPWQVETATWTIDGESVEMASWEYGADHFELVHRTSEPFDVTLTLVDGEGNEHVVERRVRPHSVANDALAIELSRITNDELAAAESANYLAALSVVAPTDRVARITAIDSFPRLSWGGVGAVHIASDGSGAPRRTFDARLETARGESVRSLVRFDDGSALLTESTPRAPSPTRRPPRLVLDAAERYLGEVDGRPRWLAQLVLRGDADIRAAVTSVEWTATGIDGVPIEVRTRDTVGRGSFMTNEPAHVQATVHFDEESGLAALELETFVTTLSERRPEEFAILCDVDWEEPVPWDPNVDPLDIEDFGWLRFRARIAAPELLMARVKSVAWSFPYQLDESPIDWSSIAPVTRRRGPVDGFSQIGGTSEEGLDSARGAVASITLSDGSTVLVSRELRGADFRLTNDAPRVRVFDHAPAEDGRSWLAVIDLPDGDPLRRTQRVAWELTGDVHSAGSKNGEAYTNPSFRCDFVGRGAATLTSYRTAGLGEWGFGYLDWQEHQRTVAPIAIEPPTPILEPWVEIVDDPVGSANVRFARLVAPTSTIARIGRVVYQVEYTDLERTLEPYLAVGELSLDEPFGTFDVRLVGLDAPVRVTAKLFEVGADEPFAVLASR